MVTAHMAGNEPFVSVISLFALTTEIHPRPSGLGHFRYGYSRLDSRSPAFPCHFRSEERWQGQDISLERGRNPLSNFGLLLAVVFRVYSSSLRLSFLELYLFVFPAFGVRPRQPLSPFSSPSLWCRFRF